MNCDANNGKTLAWSHRTPAVIYTHIPKPAARSLDKPNDEAFQSKIDVRYEMQDPREAQECIRHYRCVIDLQLVHASAGGFLNERQAPNALTQ